MKQHDFMTGLVAVAAVETTHDLVIDFSFGD